MALLKQDYRDPMLVVMARQEREIQRETSGKQMIEDPFGKMILVKVRKNMVDFKNRVNQDLLDRLGVWGRVVKDSKRPNESITGILCRQLKEHASGKVDLCATITRDQEQDAWFIERCMTNMPRNERVALIMLFCLHANPNAICRYTATRRRDFDELMYRSCVMLENIIKRRSSSKPVDIGSCALNIGIA